MLYYRYGNSAPDPDVKHNNAVPMSIVAEILKAPRETLNWLNRKYFKKKKVSTKS